MKKGIKSIFTVFIIAIIAGCTSATSTQENLQEEKWNVVSTTGEAYTADFGQDTVTFEMGNFRRGFSYTIEENVITMEETDSDNDPIMFSIEKNENEYNFTSENDEVQEQYGNLTLSPINE